MLLSFPLLSSLRRQIPNRLYRLPVPLPQGLYCVGDSTFPGQGVNAVAMSGIGCAHRVLVDLGKLPALPRALDDAFTSTLQFFRDRA